MKNKITNLLVLLLLFGANVSAQLTTDGLYTIQCHGNSKYITNPGGGAGDIVEMTESTGSDIEFIIVENSATTGKYNIITTDELYLVASDGGKGVLMDNTETNRNSNTSGALVDMQDLGTGYYRFESEPGGALKAWNGQRGGDTQLGMGSTTSTKYEWALTRIGDMPVPSPIIDVTQPIEDDNISPGASVTLQASATAEEGETLTSVEFFVDDVKVGDGVLNGDVYEYNWTAPVTEETYTITAKATSSASAVTTSDAVSVIVAALPATANLTWPSEAITVLPNKQLTLKAEATPNTGDSISKVEFYDGTTLLGEGALSGEVYELNYYFSTVGTFSITAKVTDSGSNVATSEAVTIETSLTSSIKSLYLNFENDYAATNWGWKSNKYETAGLSHLLYDAQKARSAANNVLEIDFSTAVADGPDNLEYQVEGLDGLPSTGMVYIEMYYADDNADEAPAAGPTLWSSALHPTPGTAAANDDGTFKSKSWNKPTSAMGADGSITIYPALRMDANNTAGKFYFDDVVMYYDPNSSGSDAVEPTAPSDLEASVSDNDVVLTWNEGMDEGIGIDSTFVLRAEMEEDAPEFINHVGYSTKGLPAGLNTVGNWTVVGVVPLGTKTYTDNTIEDVTAHDYTYAVIHKDYAYNYSDAVIATVQNTPPEPVVGNSSMYLNFEEESIKIIGTPDEMAGNGETVSTLFDGDFNTAFDTGANAKDDAWAGLDFGEGNEKTIDSLRYSLRIPGNLANVGIMKERLAGTKVYGANTVTFDETGTTNDMTADTTGNLLYEITSAAVDTLELEQFASTKITLNTDKSFRYVLFIFTEGSHGNCSEFEIYSNEENEINNWELEDNTADASIVYFEGSRAGSKAFKASNFERNTGFHFKNVTYDSITAQPGEYVHSIVYASCAQDGGMIAPSFSSEWASVTPGFNALDTLEMKRFTFNRQYPDTENGNMNIYPRIRIKPGVTSNEVYVDDIVLYADTNSVTDIVAPNPATEFAFVEQTEAANQFSWTVGVDSLTGVQETYILRTASVLSAAPVLLPQVVYSAEGGISGPNTVGEWSVIGTVEAETESYTDSSLTEGESYRYAIVHRDIAYNNSEALLNSEAEILAPVLSDVSASVEKGDDISATSDKDGMIYLVPDGNYADLDAIVTAKVAEVAVNENVAASIPTSTLDLGDYLVYAVDADDNLSDPSSVVIIKTVVPPVLSDVSTSVEKGDDISATSDKDGMVYLVPDAEYAGLDAVVAAKVAEVAVNENVATAISTSTLDLGDYLVYAVDADDNLSDPSDVVTVKDETAPSVPSVTVNEGAVSGTSIVISFTEATDNDAVSEYKIYLGDNVLTSLDAVPENYTYEGLQVGTEYTLGVTAIDNSGNESDMGSATATTLSPVITGFELIDATTDQKISDITDDMVIYVTNESNNLNIRTVTDPEPLFTGLKVKMDISGDMSHTQTEGGAPYAVWGDVSGDYNDNALDTGSYSLQAVIINDSQEEVIDPVSVDFTVVDSTLNVSAKSIAYSMVNVYPVPVNHTLYVSGIETGEAKVYNTSGKMVARYKEIKDGMDVSGLTKGLYIVKITDRYDNVINRRFVKR